MSNETQSIAVNETGGEVTGGEVQMTLAGMKHYCSLYPEPPRVFDDSVTPMRERLILLYGNKWVSGTVLHFYFFDQPSDGETVMLTDGTTKFFSWVGSVAEQNVVRQGFAVWSAEQIGISFEEVTDREEAEIRIGFMKDNRSWSYLGRDILKYGPNERTMNLGWDITRQGQIDTVVHEIGHTLGFNHEHQNPHSGIEWDEEAVYAALKNSNGWDRETTYWNIIRRLDASDVQGSTWDPDSVMHYPFEKGLISRPEKYRLNGLTPAGGLSPRDKSWVRSVYPPSDGKSFSRLVPAESVPLSLKPGEQRSFAIVPNETRYYEFRTFGAADAVMVLFEEDNDELRYRKGEDDSGEDRNGHFRIKLVKDHNYILRVRLYHVDRPGQTSLMMW